MSRNRTSAALQLLTKTSSMMKGLTQEGEVLQIAGGIGFLVLGTSMAVKLLRGRTLARLNRRLKRMSPKGKLRRDPC